MLSMSTQLAVPVSVLMPPANNMVLVMLVKPTPPFMISVTLWPAIGLVNPFMVMLPFSVTVCTVPLAALGAIVPLVVPKLNTVPSS